MNVRTNAEGTTSTGFTIGIGGATIRSGETTPISTLGQDGDIYLRVGDFPAQFQKVSGQWVALQNDITFVRTTSPMGLTAIIPDDSDYHAVTAGSNTNTAITLPIATEGRSVIVKDETGLANLHPVHVYPNGSDLAEGNGYLISGSFGSVTLTFHAGRWRLVRQIGGAVA